MSFISVWCAEVYNDASRNLVVSMILAGNLDVPEVCVWFANQLLRGNRCKKVDSWGTECFTYALSSRFCFVSERCGECLSCQRHDDVDVIAGRLTSLPLLPSALA